MSKRTKRFTFRWKYLFATVAFLWLSCLVLFFSNPKKFQQWLTYQTKGEVKKLGGTEFPSTCNVYFTHAWRMNDQVRTYWKSSSEDGLKREPRRILDIKLALGKGELTPIQSNEFYFVDTMWYSYPFAKHYVKRFIDDLAVRFQKKLVQTDLAGTKLVLTSLLRTKSSVNRLVKKNKNAIKHSSHLHGTTFDISYHTFIHERPLNDGEIAHLKETLAATLFEMREEQRCYVTYEYFQTCFHVVCRKQKRPKHSKIQIVEKGQKSVSKTS